MTTGNILLFSLLLLPLQSIDAFYLKSFPMDFLRVRRYGKIYFRTRTLFRTYNNVMYKYAIWMTYPTAFRSIGLQYALVSGGGRRRGFITIQ